MEREIKRERERQSLSHMTTCDRIDRARKREENEREWSEDGKSERTKEQ